jgi:hypothetical protein
MFMLLKVTYRFNEIPIKIPVFSQKQEKNNSKICVEPQKTWIDKKSEQRIIQLEASHSLISKYMKKWL